MTQLTQSPVLPAMAPATSDFDFLQGSFDVSIRRLSDPFDARSDWLTERATAVANLQFAGALSLNEVWFAAGETYAMDLQLFDPVAGGWTIRQVASHDGRLSQPLLGRFVDGIGTFSGPAEVAGRSVDVRIVWTGGTDSGATRQHYLSCDAGSTWLLTSAMDFDRRDDEPEHRAGPQVTTDFDFMNGWWRVHHRRQPAPLEGRTEWVEFDSVQRGCTYFNGALSTDEVGLAAPGERGSTFRTFDPATAHWSIYWINSRDGQLQTPVHGRFSDGVGTFLGVDEIEGRRVHVRFLWTGISDNTATWRQDFSFDGGLTWAENWEMRFTQDEAGS